jgi:Spy/CpxP family protein refolding chaperone
MRAQSLRFIKSVALLLALALSAPAAMAITAGEGKRSREHGRSRAHGLGPESPWISIMLRHRSDLNLTDEQVAALEKMRTSFQSEGASRHEALQKLEREIEDLLQQEVVDLGQVKAKVVEAGRLRSEFRYSRIEALDQARSVLTAEQREKLKSLTPTRHGRSRKSQGATS